VCEMLAVACEHPRRYAELHEWVTTLEAYGLASFGWGVAWLSDDGTVVVQRGLGRYRDEAERHGLQDVSSRRFLVHLRRPNKLSTVDFADTQPFLHRGDYAFCHNGFFDRAEVLRGSYADRLAGRADSEVGWCFFQDRLAEGVAPAKALREVDETLRGKVNLGYLDRSGTLAVYGNNLSNAMWRFTAKGADIVSTALHSDDESVFDLVYPDSTDRRLVPSRTAVVLGDDGLTAATTSSPSAATAVTGGNR
jgi:predicted glutamine amidotransferase